MNSIHGPLGLPENNTGCNLRLCFETGTRPNLRNIFSRVFFFPSQITLDPHELQGPLRNWLTSHGRTNQKPCGYADPSDLFQFGAPQTSLANAKKKKQLAALDTPGVSPPGLGWPGSGSYEQRPTSGHPKMQHLTATEQRKKKTPAQLALGDRINPIPSTLCVFMRLAHAILALFQRNNSATVSHHEIFSIAMQATFMLT